MDVTILEDLGLTPAEIKIYMALLELGSSTAGPVLEKSGLQNSVVHRALNTLIEKSLINYVLEGKRKVYQATDPENFFNFIEEKKRRFEQILPKLKEKQMFAKEKKKATIYHGKRGITEIYNSMINSSKKGDEYNTFGGGRPCEDLMGSSWWMNIHRKRISMKLKSRQVFDKSVYDLGNKIDKLSLSKVRFLSRDFEQFQETVIVGNKVAINVFTNEPYGFLIEDKTVAEGYRKHFEILWEKGK